MPDAHSREFRARAVELARSTDRPVATVAKDLRISESCLRGWIAQAHIDATGAPGRLAAAEKKELVDLRRRHRHVELENRILRRATAYLAKEGVLPK